MKIELSDNKFFENQGSKRNTPILVERKSERCRLC